MGNERHLALIGFRRSRRERYMRGLLDAKAMKLPCIELRIKNLYY